MRFSTYLLLVTLLFSLFFSCKKQNAEPDLPPETQTGADTFGCRINGRAWVPQANKPRDNNNLILLELEPVRQGSDGFFYVRTNNYKGNGGSVSLLSNVINGTGTYRFDRIDSIRGTKVTLGYNGCRYYSTDSDTYCRGSITLKRFDFQERGIVSGTFEFTIYKPGCDTVKVTDGRFDLRTF